MTHRRLLLRHGLACALLTAMLPTGAGAAWTPPQDLGPGGFTDDDTALASNARGDAVTAFSQSPGISIARATGGAPFGRAIAVDPVGVRPLVTIDARGVALIAWEYDDRSFSYSPDFRGTVTCCTGTKVVVWRPGHAPTPPRVVRRRRLVTRPGPVAAVSGRRGILVYAAGADEEQTGTLQFVPIHLDARPGTRRTISRAASGWRARSLQFVGGRAEVGLVDTRGPTRLAARRQRPTGSFGPPRVFLRVPERLDIYDFGPYSDLQMAADGRGGQLAVMERGRPPTRFVEVVRKRRGERPQRTSVRRGPTDGISFSTPSAAPDGWMALAFHRTPASASLDGVGYSLAVDPRGRAVVTRMTGLGDVHSPAASVTVGGAGVAGFGGSLITAGGPYLGRASFAPLAGGRPQPAGALVRGPFPGTLGNISMTSNPRDRARVVWEEGMRVLASRLE